MRSEPSEHGDKMNEQFITAPNLPQNRVSRVLVSGYRPQIISELKKNGINTMTFGRLESIGGSEAYHADMSFCHTGGNRIFISCNAPQNIKDVLRLSGAELYETKAPVTAQRPLLNICIFGKNVLANTCLAEKSLIDMLKASGHRIIHTNQGYTKCSCAVVNNNALITSDEGIYKLCLENKIDVLKIKSGHIELDGYKYGFIGGCCGFVSQKTLAFSGNIRLHPDYKSIRAFSANYGIDLLSLSEEPLYDIGGILPIKEYHE